MMVMAPFIKPDAPRPAIARPPISIGEDLASPHTNEPSSKVKKNIKYVHYVAINIANSFYGTSRLNLGIDITFALKCV